MFKCSKIVKTFYVRVKNEKLVLPLRTIKIQREIAADFYKKLRSAYVTNVVYIQKKYALNNPHDISSLWREVFLSLVEAPLFWLFCNGAHFTVCEEDHGTGLALRLALGCQGSCDIVSNWSASLYMGSFNIL